MKTVDRIFRTHPHADTLHLDDLGAATDALVACIEACTVCADACLAEPHVMELRRCIRSDQDCADVCTATLHVITRQTETIGDLVRQQLHACVVACQLCAEECEKHHHAHCRLCAIACRRCQEACNRMLGQISSAGSIPDDPMESPSLTV